MVLSVPVGSGPSLNRAITSSKINMNYCVILNGFVGNTAKYCESVYKYFASHRQGRYTDHERNAPNH